LVYSTVLKNVKNFRESYVFHCLVIKVIRCYLTTDSSFIISLTFQLVKNFFYFFKFFSVVCFSNSDIISCLQFPVNTFFIFFSTLFNQFFVVCRKKIRLIQKRIYHIIIFSSRQALFYIFLHIFLHALYFIRLITAP
jgi:hypothetical protein